MGCLLSKDAESQPLIERFNYAVSEKCELLENIQTMKSGQRTLKKYLGIQDNPESTKESISSSDLMTKLKSISATIKSLNYSDISEEPQYQEAFSILNDAFEDGFLEKIKEEVKEQRENIKFLNTKCKESMRIMQGLGKPNTTFEDISNKKKLLEIENNNLNEKLLKLKNEIIEVRDYINMMKRRRIKRRFTVVTLPPSRQLLKNKIMMKNELIKKIEMFKAEQEKFEKALEEKRSKLEYSPRGSDINQLFRFSTIGPRNSRLSIEKKATTGLEELYDKVS
ncbi:hypothetical protein SteCoe_27528 [Stentor coeruleus]|uniref:Uncharacterized protein n=1 Tax=Stentor coeruleus TaxID=5963 RepID=A0A1R2BAK6_9CILI|nr:hypothetical protein SteCoe_27528 [Stentor coeruleus]